MTACVLSRLDVTRGVEMRSLDSNPPVWLAERGKTQRCMCCEVLLRRWSRDQVQSAVRRDK